MAVLYVPHYYQALDDDGNPLAYGKLYTYAAGTSTPKETYTTAAGNISHTNPIELDAAGRAIIFLTGAYKFALHDADDVPIDNGTTDNVTAFTAATETNEGFFQTFSGDGEQTSFALSENLGSDEKALFISAEFEYILNGTFASDTVWIKGTGWTIGSGIATATGAISTAIEQSSNLTLVEGKSYSITYTITRSAGSITPSLGGTAGTARSSSGTYTETIIAGSSQTISFGTSSFTGTLDDVSIRAISGIDLIDPSFYTVNGTALTFTIPPAEGVNNIKVRAPYSLIGAAGAAQVAADDAIAAAADAEAFVDAGAYKFDFDDSTTMGDPAAGNFRLNNATIASATAIAVADVSSSTGNPDVSDAIATWGASTNTVKGQIKITKVGTPATFAVFNVTAAVTDNTDWLEIAVDYVDGNGTLTDADECYFQFIRTGDKGDTGAQGPTGTVSGASAATLDIAADGILFLDADNSDALSEGVLPIASEAEAEAGTDETKLMNPLRTAQAIAAFVDIPESGLQRGGFRDNYYYSGLSVTYQGNAGTISTGNLHGIFFEVDEPTTFTRIGISVSTSSGGNARLGIYAVENGIPTDLVVDAGEINTGSTGVKELTISELLPVGVYVLCACVSGSPSFHRCSDGIRPDSLRGLSSFAQETTYGIRGAHTYGALPSTYPSTTNITSVNALPYIWLRKV